MDAAWFNGAPIDDYAWDIRPDQEKCPDCGASPDDPCEVMCQCRHCQEQRLRVMDVDPEGEVA